MTNLDVAGGLDAELDAMGLGPARAFLTVVPSASAPVGAVAEAVPEEMPPSPLVLELDRCREWLEGSLEGSLFTLREVAGMVLNEGAQLWPGRACAIVTQLQQYETGLALQSVVAGGDLQEIASMVPGIEAWARLQGCTMSLAEGRKGFGRVLAAQGYEPFSVTVRKALC